MKKLLIPLVIIAFIAAISGLYLNKSRLPFRIQCENKLKELGEAQSSLCTSIESKFFSEQNGVQHLSPQTVGSPALPIDNQVRFVSFYDPSYFSSFGYCYFAFRGWFDPKKFSPKQMAHSGSGFAILKSELTGYRDWLASDVGKSCATSLKETLNVGVANLEREMGDKVSLIAINPLGAIRTGASLEGLLREAQLTLNHERIHAIQVSCASVDLAAKKYWMSLSMEHREKLKESYPNYDWTNETTAIREAYAFYNEESPSAVLTDAGTCFTQK